MKLWRSSVPRVIEHRFLAMGTELSIKLVCMHPSLRPAALRAMDEVQRRIHEFGRGWWAWGEGALAGINRVLLAGQAATIPAAMQPLFARAWQIRCSTGGLFEPRIAELVRLWGFDDITRLRLSPPPADEIAALLSALQRAPDYAGGGSYGPAPGIAWDFGGIAKGYIVDRALSILRERGFGDAVVDAGGNLAVRGRRHAHPWRIAIRDPRSPPEQLRLLATLDAVDEAVITHGDDQRYFEHAGRRYAHIISPVTGAPVQGLRSLTVVHADATLADGAGAALFVAGPQAWPALARKLGITQVLALREDGVIQATSALAARLQTRAHLQVCSSSCWPDRDSPAPPHSNLQSR